MKLKMACLLGGVLVTMASSGQQAPCAVLDEDLQGSYTGECSKGKAHGMGKASGKHQYEGSFKNGLPQGRGKYTWPDGSWYEGNYDKGLRQGEGTMHLKVEGGKDSVIRGSWKNDVLDKLNDKDYILHSKTYMVQSVVISADKGMSGLSEIAINLESVSGGSFDIRGEIEKPTLQMVNIREGSYMMRSDVDNMQKRNIYYLRDVVFPFRAILRIQQGTVLEEVDIELLKPDRWKVDIKLRQ